MALGNSVLVAILLETRAQMFERPLILATELGDRLLRLFLVAWFASIHVVEAARQFARDLNMRDLVLADRHLVGAVDQDVGAHQERIAEEAVGRQVLVRHLFLLVLVGRHAFKPAKRRHHRQQQMQFRVFRHLRLDEQRSLLGIDAGRQPVDHHFPGRLRDSMRIVVLRGQRVPVGDEEQAGILVLQFDPVLQHPMIVTKVQAARGAHSGEDSFCVHSVSSAGR